MEAVSWAALAVVQQHVDDTAAMTDNINQTGAAGRCLHLGLITLSMHAPENARNLCCTEPRECLLITVVERVISCVSACLDCTLMRSSSGVAVLIVVTVCSAWCAT